MPVRSAPCLCVTLPLLVVLPALVLALPGALRAQQRPVLRARPVQGAIQVDGELSEATWQAAPGATGFVQAEPREGQPASEETEVWVAYDDDNLYVAARLHGGTADAVVSSIRKDFSETEQDAFEVILDTFRDRRNGYHFITNAEGARADRQVANEGREINTSWDAPWTVRTSRQDASWTLEMAIPFRALRFDPDRTVWGINFSRRIRHRNELDFWAPVPRSYNIARLSLAGDLEGLPARAPGRDLRLKPYVLGGAVRETGQTDFERQTEVGLDAKAGLLGGLTLDVTANPDFAQVEADVQQVNLTQFSQFFPEKREFFLENSGLFYVGDAARNNRVVLTPAPDEDLLLFFSRRIGLTSAGAPVPIQGGARLSGTVAGLNVGALAMRTDDVGERRGDDFVVLRLRQNVLSGSDVGGIFMMRDAVGVPDDYNRVFGADANVRFFGQLDWSSYVVGTRTPGLSGGEYAWRTSLNREGNFQHVKVGVMQLGENFNDELGYYRRTGVRKWFVDWGVRPRPEALRARGIREMHPHIVWNYYEDLDGRIVAKRLHTGYTFFLNDGGFWELSVNPAFERIEEPFRISPDIDAIPPGGYGWTEVQLRGNSDPSRRFALGATGIVGGLWSGTQKTIRLDATFRPSHRFEAEAGVQRTAAELDVPAAEFTRTFWTGRANYSFTTDMFVDALVQWDPGLDLVNTNIRFNLIHHPLSDLFIVYNEQRFTTGDGTPPGRGLIVKLTHMIAF